MGNAGILLAHTAFTAGKRHSQNILAGFSVFQRPHDTMGFNVMTQQVAGAEIGAVTALNAGRLRRLGDGLHG